MCYPIAASVGQTLGVSVALASQSGNINVYYTSKGRNSKLRHAKEQDSECLSISNNINMTSLYFALGVVQTSPVHQQLLAML